MSTLKYVLIYHLHIRHNVTRLIECEKHRHSDTNLKVLALQQGHPVHMAQP